MSARPRSWSWTPRGCREESTLHWGFSSGESELFQVPWYSHQQGSELVTSHWCGHRVAWQLLLFLRWLRRFGLSSGTLINFYRYTVESTLSGEITTWYGYSTTYDLFRTFTCSDARGRHNLWSQLSQTVSSASDHVAEDTRACEPVPPDPQAIRLVNCASNPSIHPPSLSLSLISYLFNVFLKLSGHLSVRHFTNKWLFMSIWHNLNWNLKRV